MFARAVLRGPSSETGKCLQTFRRPQCAAHGRARTGACRVGCKVMESWSRCRRRAHTLICGRTNNVIRRCAVILLLRGDGNNPQMVSDDPAGDGRER